MASREKTRQFLEESEAYRHYSNIVEYTLTYFIHKAAQAGNARLAADLQKAKDEYHVEFATGVEITEDVYAELFTDEELDELIILHSNPALKRARDLSADIFNRILQKIRSEAA